MAAPRDNFDRETFNQMVNEVLEYKGVPRDYLFEYPYNEHQSREIIAKAEALVESLMSIINP